MHIAEALRDLPYKGQDQRGKALISKQLNEINADQR